MKKQLLTSQSTKGSAQKKEELQNLKSQNKSYVATAKNWLSLSADQRSISEFSSKSKEQKNREENRYGVSMEDQSFSKRLLDDERNVLLDEINDIERSSMPGTMLPGVIEDHGEDLESQNLNKK